jgi:hypothetical protein
VYNSLHTFEDGRKNFSRTMMFLPMERHTKS